MSKEEKEHTDKSQEFENTAASGQSQKGIYSYRLSNTVPSGQHESFRISQNFFRQVLASLDDYVVFTTDVEGNISSWNAAAKHVLGFSEEEIIGKPFSVIFTDEDITNNIHLQELKLAQQQGQVLDERIHQRKDGTHFWANGKVFPLYDDAQTLRGFTKILRDVSEHKELEQAKEKLKEKEEALLEQAEIQRAKLHAMLMYLPTPVCVLQGSDLVYEFINPAYQNLFGDRDLINKPLLEALPELANQSVLKIVHDVYRSGKSFVTQEMSIMLVREEGGLLREGFFSFTYQPRFNELDEVDGIFVFAQDVTFQVQARKLVEESANRFETLLEGIPQMTWTCLPSGEITFYNQRWYDYTGQDAENLEEGGWESVVYADDLPKTLKQFQNSLKTGNMLEVENRIQKSDGTYHWFLNQGLPIRNKNAEIVLWVGTATSIDDQKKLESNLHQLTHELAAANEELATANEEIMTSNEEIVTSNEELSASNSRLNSINADLDNFIYTASHDLKAPITNIEGLLQMLKASISGEMSQKSDVQKILTMMDMSITRFKNTILDLTQVAKLDKEFDAQKTLVNIPNIVQDVLLDLDLMIQKKQAKINIELNNCDMVQFSPKNMKSIIYNLISNAIKYSHPERNPEITISCNQFPDYVVLYVKDNGLGLTPTDQKRAFSMFKRFHSHVEGTGIGLYIVKKIMDNAGGRIVLQSELGVGSTFTVYFKR